MRRAALLLLASGCLDAVGVSFEQHPEAHTTILIDQSQSGESIVAWVFDHDSNARSEVALNVGHDDRIVLLAYRQPAAWLQLEGGLLIPEESSARTLPPPDLGATARASPFAGNPWLPTEEIPSFAIPEYSITRCAEAGLCFAGPGADYCGACTATASLPAIEAPLPPRVVAHPPRRECAAGWAHFLGDEGCTQVGASCPATGGAAVAQDSAALLAAIASRTPTIALGAATYDLPGIAIDAPLTLIGCNSVIRLPPEGALDVLSTLAVRSLRFEGGVAPILVRLEGRADLEDVSFDGGGPIALVSAGRLAARRISLEGRDVGVRIDSGRARIDGLAIRNVKAHGVACAPPGELAAPTVELANVSIEGTPINAQARAIYADRCTLSIEGALIERGRRTAIEVFNPETIIPLLTDVTIRDIDGREPGPGVGGIISRNRARFGLIARIWIERVNGAGIEVTDPRAVIEDVRIDGVKGNNYFTPTGIHAVSFEGQGGEGALARVQIVDVPGAPLVFEAAAYEPRTRWVVSDVSIDSDTAERAAILVDSADLDLSRVALRGGVDGVVVTDGSDSTIRDLSVESCARDAVVLESDEQTRLALERAIITGCQDGIRNDYAPQIGARPEHGELSARNVAISGCASYAVLVEGAPIRVEDFLLEGNGAGLGLGAGATFAFDRGVVRGNAIGARAVPDLDLHALLVNVLFEENATALDIDPQVP